MRYQQVGSGQVGGRRQVESSIRPMDSKRKANGGALGGEEGGRYSSFRDH